ncbi:MAG: VacB/RNase II family 3'-5' exoribonuclease, partial [Bacteroidia bacterium]|nr:VacB/RNase II family 3'-5' exoribonuclease [Bacteroidia bacterium]
MKEKKGGDGILSKEKVASEVMEVFKKNPGKNYNPRQLAKQIRRDIIMQVGKSIVKDHYEDHFNKHLRDEIAACLEILVAKGSIIETEPYRYKLKPVHAYQEGKIEITQSGAAFLLSENDEEDIYISEHSVHNALHGDRVKVLLRPQHKKKRLEGEVAEVLERARTTFPGTIQLSPKFAFLVPDSPRMHTDIFIPLQDLNKATHGMKAVAEITDWKRGEKNPSGKIIQVLGMPGENETEIQSILTEFGLPEKFPSGVEAEVAQFKDTISVREIANRRDFRKRATFTIDPVDAKDFDDALSIRKLENGFWEIGVHIADVSHYVKEGTLLDKEAYRRATSVYLVDRVVPMLPEKLSNHLCSLRPDEDKLCYAAVFEMDDHGVVHKKWFGRTVIHSKKRFSYEEAQNVLDTGSGIFASELNQLNTLAKILRKERFKVGAIAFEKTEMRFELDEKGNPVAVHVKESLETNQLIEEFMLLANKNVAELAGKSKGRKNDFVYRIHEGPAIERITDFARLALAFGYKINTSNDRTIGHSLNKLLNDVKGKDEQNMLEQLAIRCMSKAKYTSDNVGHY